MICNFSLISFFNAQTKDTTQHQLQEVVILQNKQQQFETSKKQIEIDSTILNKYSTSSLSDMLANQSTIHIKSYGNGKCIGFECNIDGYEFKFRCDYDPGKEFHYNVELGYGAFREKMAFTYPDSHNSYYDRIDTMHKIMINALDKKLEDCSAESIMFAIQCLLNHVDAVIEASTVQNGSIFAA